MINIDEGSLYKRDFTGREKPIPSGEKVIYFDYRIASSINTGGNLYVFSGTESDGPNIDKAKYILVDPGQTYIFLDGMQSGSLELGSAGTYVFTGIASEEPNVGKIIYVLKAGSMKSVEDTKQSKKNESESPIEEKPIKEEAFPEDPPGSIRVKEFISRFHEVAGKRYKHFRWDKETSETVLVPVDSGEDHSEEGSRGFVIAGDLDGQTIDLGENNYVEKEEPLGIDIASLVARALSMKSVKPAAEVYQKDSQPEIPQDILERLSSFTGHQLIKARGTRAIKMYSQRMTDSQINDIKFKGTWVQWGELPGTEYDIWVKEK